MPNSEQTHYKTYTCPQAKDCGGCEWLAVPYPIQLERKKEWLTKLFEPLGIEPQDVLGMDEPLAYRDKVMTPFKPAPRGKLHHGMYKLGTHDIISCPKCLVENPQARPIFDSVAKLCRRFRIPAYNEDTGHGLLRHAIVRCAESTDEVMLTLVINGKEFPHKKEFVRELRAEQPQISTIIFNINTRKTNAVLGNSQNVAYGQGWIQDKLCGQDFRIPSGAFYQTNPRQTRLLYDTAIDLAALKGGENVLDAYCGIGTIGIIAARRSKRDQQRAVDEARKRKYDKKVKMAKKKGAKIPKMPPRTLAKIKPVHIVGVETTPAAIKIAEENARINHVNGAEFIEADAGSYLKNSALEFDVVFMDPPRAGASQDFIDGLLASRPERIVYVSCNPQTQLRDIELLSEAYEVKMLIPVDMFPHTKHVETVALLVCKKAVGEASK